MTLTIVEGPLQPGTGTASQATLSILSFGITKNISSEGFIIVYRSQEKGKKTIFKTFFFRFLEKCGEPGQGRHQVVTEWRGSMEGETSLFNTKFSLLLKLSSQNVQNIPFR